MEEQHRIPQIDIRHKIDEARLALNLCLTTQAEKHISWSKHKYYTMGDKPTTMLARKLVPRPYTPTLPKFRLPTGHPTQNPELILKAFHNFYSRLYSPLTKYEPPKAEMFFRDIQLPKLTQAHMELMDKDFTELEIKMAIKTIHPSKAPGPDGFSGHYNRKYQDILVPHLCSYFNDLRRGNKIPSHENVIPKPPMRITSFPTSLLHPQFPLASLPLTVICPKTD